MDSKGKPPSDNTRAELERVLQAFDEARRAGREFTRDRTGRPHTRADIYSSFGEYDKALHEWEKEISIARQTNNVKEETDLLIIAGAYYAKAGNIPQGMEFINLGLELAKKTSHHEQEAQAHIELGQIWSMLQRHRDALEHFNEVVAIAQSTNNRRYLHLGLGNTGAIYGRMGRYQESIELLTQAGGIAQATGDKLDEAKYASSIGMAHFHLREGGKALMFFDYYQQLCQEIGIPADPEIAQLAQELREVFRKRAG
jgi:tetratricopeptide (TPR) repeat protein